MRSALIAGLALLASARGVEPATRVLGRSGGAPTTARWETADGRASLKVQSAEFGIVLPDDRLRTAEDFAGEELAGVLAYQPRPGRTLAEGEPTEVRVTSEPRTLRARFREEPRVAAAVTELTTVRAPARITPDGRAVVVAERWILVLPEGARAALRPADDGATVVRVTSPWTSARADDGGWWMRAEGPRLLACDPGETPEAALRSLSAAPPRPRPSGAPPGAPR